jgi:EpsI family protein
VAKEKNYLKFFDEEKHMNINTAGMVDEKSKGKTRWSLITGLLILGLTMGYLILYKPVSVPLKRPLNAFPLMIGEWVGRETKPEDSLLKEVKTRDRLDRVYQDKNGEKITLSIRYFPIQDPEQKIVGYRSDGLYKEVHTITIPTSRGQVEVNTSYIRNKGDRSVFYFWYDINGKMMTNRYKAKLESFFGAALKRKTNGAIVVISMDRSSLPTSSESIFLNKSIPIIHDFLKTD